MMDDDSDPLIKRRAVADFETAFRHGFWRAISSWFTQRTNDLLPFDEVRETIPLRGQSYVGLKEVEIDKIIGSVGRYRDFDRAFLPRHTHTRGRWVSIDEAHLKEVTLPPIELYKLGNAYFVRDGNHRVSVARQRGQAFIDAHVTEIKVDVQIDEKSNIDDLIRVRELAYFLERTRISEIIPEVRLELTLPGGYDKLLEHIQVHQYFMGLDRQKDITWEEAVRGWYDDVYLPLVRVMRERNIMKKFTDRTETDLYVWIIEHLWYLREQYKADISLEIAAKSFTDEFARTPGKFILGLFRAAGSLLSPVLNEDDAHTKL
ncbi:MAG: DUF4032 domain-containing protein [Anaerolineae bacterium]|jgi:hypothetical protein|nr:DUF4032 domain-containing protein [Anaerolineae bacterium]